MTDLQKINKRILDKFVSLIDKNKERFSTESLDNNFPNKGNVFNESSVELGIKRNIMSKNAYWVKRLEIIISV